jgi:RNA-directed DNA polymerase
VVKAHCAGRVEMFRYCDDLVVCCQYERDARRINKALKSRLEKFNLRLNEEKTKLVPFDKRAYHSDSKSTSFDFLGFTFYWGRARRGAVIPKIKTIGKRFRSKLQRVNTWFRKVRNKYPLAAGVSASPSIGRVSNDTKRIIRCLKQGFVMCFSEPSSCVKGFVLSPLPK